MWTWLNGSLGLMVAVLIGSGVLMTSASVALAQSVREVTLVNIEFEGSKIWVPGPVVVEKGDTVKIQAINQVKSDPAVHGLAIPGYGIEVVVNAGKPESIEFKADKAGIFPISCHLHPTHVGTQLVVLE
jgi:nitrosocyanin